MKNTVYEINENMVYWCKFHVVWCTKYRRKLLTRKIKRKLNDLILVRAEELSIIVDELNIQEDHVQIMVRIDARSNINKVTKSLKSYSSKELRATFPELKTKVPTLWTNSYMATSIGYIDKENVERFLGIQKTSQRQTGCLG